MKKKRLTGALALASCVMLLTGCDSDALWGLGGYWNKFAGAAKGYLNNIALKLGLKEEQKEEKKEEQKPSGEGEQGGEEQKVEVKLEVSELPELEVGESLELDQFVTVSGTSESWSVSLAEASANVASLEGHTLSANAEGQISLQFSVGSVSKDASTSSIDPLRKAFRSFSEGFVGKDNYAIYHLDYDDTEESFSAGGIMSHTSDYTYDDYFQETEDDYLGGGYVKVDDSMYSYVLEETENSTEQNPEYAPHFMILGTEPASLGEITGPFGISASDFEVQYATVDEDGKTVSAGVFADNTLFLPATKANFAALNKIMQGTIDFSDYGYTFNGAYVDLFWSQTETDPDTGEEVTEVVYSIVPAYLSSQQKDAMFYDTMFLVVQADDFKVSELDEYLESGAVPQSLPLADFTEKLSLIASQSSFTVQTRYGSYANSTALPAAYAEHYGLPLADATGYVNGYVTPTQVHFEEVGLEHLSYGYIVGDDDKLYYYGDFVADPVVPVQVTEPAADVDGGFPAHAVYEMYQAKEIDVQVPLYEAAAPAEYEIYPGEDAYEIYVNSTEAEYLAYKAALEEAGWSVISDYDENNPIDFVLRFGSTSAICELLDYTAVYDQYLVYFSTQNFAEGHYVATASSYESIATLPAYYNYSFLKSDVKIINPDTLEKFSVYDPIFVNEISSESFQFNFGTEAEPNVHNLTTKTAKFSGLTGNYLLQYLVYLQAPVTGTSDRFGLGDALYNLLRTGYAQKGDMSISYTVDDDTSALQGVKISFRYCWGQLDASTYVYWGFDTTFSFTSSIPQIEIEFPAAQTPVQP